ncbi:pyrroline-5-carboxylate reductase dimerization domain-containing protein [Janibacter hoylei]
MRRRRCCAPRSPRRGGSTAAALARLEAHGVRHALADAVAACAERAG